MYPFFKKYINSWIFPITLLSIFISTQISLANENNETTLSGQAIDLLMGTPEGITEPLDNRRNKLKDEEGKKFNKFHTLFEEENIEDFSWDDAEEEGNKPDQNHLESQYLDLLSELGDNKDSESIFPQKNEEDKISSNNEIETDL